MSSCRRTSSKPKPLESNENELRNPTVPIPFPPPRSPLLSIQDPAQIEPASVKSAVSTPKAAQSPAARSGARVSVGRERGCSSSRVLRGVQDGKGLDAVEVPYFELSEDPAFWEDRNVQVLIRIRPVSAMESASQGYTRCLIQESSQTLTWIGHPETRFTFDHVACEAIAQEKLFRVVGLPMVDNCMSGYNSCMFAYGQTGSGKTYTMMGEINEIDTNLSEERGMTPRIFEYLFMRIKEEEEQHSVEQLKYSCKCSFLEIYNEQITDLLEPSSTNLQLREDIKKGVYVENLKEYEVSSVKDVMELLLQGAANRKMAATHMNSESSRSHSVFTCAIESRRERDSMTHLRFGRLNLVDLAGSERQKSSGAEGERLKEAANINRSLSTLGLVIMTLVDITNGKNRHVPYRDSRLTFLLQDSLGGNSKTTVIANISPSISCASETFSTLKFAQRAKLIQNNAKVNEDASGDVMALQRQIHKLKDQLTVLTRHQNFPRSPCFSSTNLEQTTSSCKCENSSNDLCFLNCEIKQLEASLGGALRREEVADTEVKRLEAEIKHMSRLIHQREDDVRRTKTLLRFREEKLRRVELLADDLVSSDGYLMEENFALSQEIQLLRERVDQNPDLTQFALENMRLLEQLRVFQNFFKLGERDLLLAEVSHLRNQLLKVLEGRFSLVSTGATQGSDDQTKELGECRRQLDVCLENNAKLMREVDNLHVQLKQLLAYEQSSVLKVNDTTRNNNTVEEPEKKSSVELTYEDPDHILQTNTYLGISDTDNISNLQKELRDATLIIKDMETKQVHLLAELDDLKKENKRYLEQLKHCTQTSERSSVAPKFNHLNGEAMMECDDTTRLKLQETSKRMNTELEQAKILNKMLTEENLIQSVCHQEQKNVQEQVQAEAAETILYLQEEISTLNQEFDLKTRNEELSSKLSFLIQENVKLSDLVAARDTEINALSYEWEKAIVDLTNFLIDGCRSLDDASEYYENVVESFLVKSACVSKHVERAIKIFIEKETLILDLQRGLEDAQMKGQEMKSKLNSLRGATLAIAEVQQQENDENTKELLHLKKLIGEKVCIIQELEHNLKYKEDHILEVRKASNAAYEVIKRLYDMDCAESLKAGEIKLKIEELLDVKWKSRNFSKDDQNNVGTQEAEPEEYACVLGGIISEVETAVQRTHAYFSQLPAVMAGNMVLNSKFNNEENRLTTTDVRQIQENLEEMEENDIGCLQTSEILHLKLNHAMQDLEERTKPATSLLIRFETVQETMEEAELVIKALLKANEGAKHEKDFWKQASAELLAEKNLLLEEVQRFESFNSSVAKQFKNVQSGKVEVILTEMLGLTSSLSISVQQLQKTVVEDLNAICSQIFNFGKEFVQIIGSSRSWLEEMMSEVMQKDFALFVQYQCHKGSLIELIMHLGTYSEQINQGDKESNDLSLKRELARKDKLIEGLLFDLRLLQESTSNVNDRKDEIEEMEADFNLVRCELATKTAQIDQLLAELARSEAALSSSRSEMEQAEKELVMLSDENNKLKLVLEDAYVSKSETEEILEEKMKVIEGLQREILSLNYSFEGHSVASVEEIIDELNWVNNERDRLHGEIVYLNDRLEMASALADENEAIAVEARQVAEASKILADEKEKEVKVLERSVEELEGTINILERKVCDMKEEVERHYSIRKGLELEVQALTQRMLTVETAAENLIEEYSNVGGRSQIPRGLDDRIIELFQAREHIRDLEMENSYTAEEIKQYRQYISELVLHSEVQSSLYKEKFKELEAMVSEVKPDAAGSNPSYRVADKTEKSSARIRGSGSPFRCISSLLQQMSLEKDQELSAARHRIEELEVLAGDRQKEVCMLTARLAAVDSMTHDVIRDLMGVRLDMTNYANLIDQEQLQKLLEKSQQQYADTSLKEKEVLSLKKQNDSLIEERESLVEEINERKAEILAIQVMVERLQQRDQLLTAQNDMLKMDKANLQRRITELDERMKSFVRSPKICEQPKNKASSSNRVGREELSRRLAQSDKLLSHMRTSTKFRDS